MRYSDVFGSCHPAVNFLYFVLVIAFSMCLTHPVCLLLSVCGAVIYHAVLLGPRSLRKSAVWMVPMAVLAAVINPAFTHQGVTILAYLPSGNPLTLESMLYGLASAALLSATLLWFTCYNAVMTSDKFIYLFGRVIPALSLVLSMTMRFVPRFRTQLHLSLIHILEQIPQAPAIQPEKSCPLAHAPFDQVRRCALRVLVYHDRIAVEFFHAITDGTGGTIFLKTLLAEYLCQKYGITVPAEDGVLGRLEEPDEEELEDSFLRYAGDVKASRKEATAYHLSGTPEPDGFKNLVTLMVPTDALRSCAREYGVTVTELLAAAMMQAIDRLQAEKEPRRSRRKPVKVLIPVNLRNLFPTRTLRNFASYITPEIDPRMGDFTFREICAAVHHRMGLENNPHTMQAKFAANVASERSPVLRVMPLFVKNLAMKLVFDAVGERKSCLCLSNLGNVRLPEAMAPYVRRMDFIIGVQAAAPHGCAVVSWNGTAYINCIRNIREPELELHFYQVLHELGLPVKAESNQR